LGNALQGAKDLEGALRAYGDAIAISPDFVAAHMNRGKLCLQMSLHELALESYQHVVKINPALADAWSQRGVVLRRIGDNKEAIESFKRALELNGSDEFSSNQLGSLYIATNQFEAAIEYFRLQEKLFRHRINPKVGLSKVLPRVVPDWHVPMMNEEKRNNAYFDALKTVISPDKLVLEIGTGSGLLSMMSAKLGANTTVTCEAVPLIANVAGQIIKDNGYEQAIRVVPKPSFQIAVGRELPEKADILVSEIFSNELLAEHVLPAIEDAKRRLVKADACIIPGAGTIMIALLGGELMGDNLTVDKVSGFDVRRFNAISPRKKLVFRNDLQPDLLSNGVAVFHFDFVNQASFPAENKVIEIPATASGRCYGIIQWIRFELVPGVVYENHPQEASHVSGWQHCVYQFPEPEQLNIGDTLRIRAMHDRINPWFELER
jgi:predicted RNA methylase